MANAFEDIEVKENAVELLEHALRRKRKKCMIATGSMTDPYLPLEMELGNVRKALGLICDLGFGFTVFTKSDRILRDLDLLQKINEKTKCVVQMTLTTYDEELCVEAGVYGVVCFGMGGNPSGGQQGVFLSAVRPPVSSSEGQVYTDLWESISLCGYFGRFEKVDFRKRGMVW